MNRPRPGVKAWAAVAALAVLAAGGAYAATRDDRPAQVAINRMELLDTVFVLWRAGGARDDLARALERVPSEGEHRYFGIAPTPGTEVHTTPRYIEAADAVLGRDAWLTPPLRVRLRAAAEADGRAAAREDESTRTAVLLSTAKILRAMGESGAGFVSPADGRAICAAASGETDEVMDLGVASELLELLGEAGCAWSPQVARTVTSALDWLGEQEEVTLGEGLFGNAAARVLSGAGATPATRAELDRLRQWARDVLRDAAPARLPERPHPLILRLLVEVLPAGEPVVLSDRLKNDLLRGLTYRIDD